MTENAKPPVTSTTTHATRREERAYPYALLILFGAALGIAFTRGAIELQDVKVMDWLFVCCVDHKCKKWSESECK